MSDNGVSPNKNKDYRKQVSEWFNKEYEKQEQERTVDGCRGPSCTLESPCYYCLKDAKEKAEAELALTKEYWRNDVGIRQYEVGRLREALEWYAKLGEIAEEDGLRGMSAVFKFEEDKGKRARDALGGQGDQDKEPKP